MTSLNLDHPSAPPGECLRWPIPEELESAPAVANRNQFGRVLAGWEPEKVVANFAYLSAGQMRTMVALAERYLLDRPLSGTGIELGAGCGLLSSVVAASPVVDRIYAVEVVAEMARAIIPKIARWQLGSDATKVVPVIGSFDEVALPDASLDFAVEYDSLHHSDDLPRTVTECARVLKPGGRLLCFDRCHPDTVSDEQVEEMLSYVYPPEWLAESHYPPGITLTRRDNGEHEYRQFEWVGAFRQGGLRLVKQQEFAEAETPKTALKGLLSLLPESLRRKMYKGDGPTPATTAMWLARRLGYSPTLVAPRRTTMFLLEKPR